jgi:putative membrane protein
MRWALLGSALMVTPLVACSRADKAATEVQSAAQAQVNPTLSTTDTNFINQAAAGGLAEVQLGELAAKKAGTPAVRRFGQQMVRDHTPVNQQLMALAQAKQLSPSTTLDAPNQQTYDTLNGLRGRAFDQQYLQGQLTAHQDQLTLFQTEAQSGTDPEVKTFAAKNQGMIQEHVDELQRLTAAHSGARRHRAQS